MDKHYRDYHKKNSCNNCYKVFLCEECENEYLDKYFCSLCEEFFGEKNLYPIKDSNGFIMKMCSTCIEIEETHNIDLVGERMEELKEFTTEELQEEIEKRKKIREECPKKIDTPNWEPAIKMCEGYIKELVENHYAREDNKQYIFEAAVEAVFGKKIWEFVKTIE